MNIPFHESDIQTFRELYLTISEMRASHPTVITLAGSAKTQPPKIQRLIHEYFDVLSQSAGDAVFIVGGRGEHGSVMDTMVDECYHRKLPTFVVGIEPIFDLGERVAEEHVFGFKNISLRCDALTQLADLLIVFPGGIGTIQEIIAPLMHQKLDVTFEGALLGPRAIFVATDEPNPVTEFLPLLDSQAFISTQEIASLIPVTLTNFQAEFNRSL